LSTLADQVGGCAMVLQPLYELIRARMCSLAAGCVVMIRRSRCWPKAGP
jgi:hypothetical protein